MNDGKDVEGASNQLIRCIFCYVNPKNVPNPRTKNKKVLSNVWYNCFEETCRCKSFHNCKKKLEEKFNNKMIKSVER